MWIYKNLIDVFKIRQTINMFVESPQKKWVQAMK